MTYAAKTRVHVDRSQREIEELVGRSGATKFMRAFDSEVATIAFEIADRRIMFELKLPQIEAFESIPVGKGKHRRRLSPSQQEGAHAAAIKARWRALLLTIKAKLVSVDAGIETFEEAFLAQVVVPHEGRATRFGKVATKSILEAYTSGTMPPLLPSGDS